MDADGPLTQLAAVVAVLDDVGVPYALGGSLAASFFGEPRSTMDVDIAVVIDSDRLERIIERSSPDYVVAADTARRAVIDHGSFNLIPRAGGMKVNLFVLGGDVLDRRQIERRLSVEVPGLRGSLWVTAPEDQVLRKLAWSVAGGAVSDRQWRDVLGLLSVSGAHLDLADLRSAADAAGLTELLERALDEAGSAGD